MQMPQHKNKNKTKKQKTKKEEEAQFINTIYLVNQRRPLVQLDDPFAVLASTSTLTMLYKWLKSDGFEEYLDSNLYKKYHIEIFTSKKNQFISKTN